MHLINISYITIVLLVRTRVSQRVNDQFVQSHWRLNNSNSVAASCQQLGYQQQVGEQKTAHVRLVPQQLSLTRSQPHLTKPFALLARSMNC